MPYQAIGRGVRRTAKGLEVKVELMNSETAATVRFQAYDGPSLPAIQQQIKADLDQLVDGETDAALSAAVVGQLLATSQAAEVVAPVQVLSDDAPIVAQVESEPVAAGDAGGKA